MDSGGMVGTTVTVGSVAELANILANMPPEQLQNVQLDPILYNALFQTLDSNPQILDGNNQVVDNSADQESGAVQQSNNEALVNSNGPKLKHTSKSDQQVSQQKTQFMPVVGTKPPVLKINKPSTDKLLSQNTGKVISTHSTFPQTSCVSSNVISTQRKSIETIPLQQKRTSVTPTVEKQTKKSEVERNINSQGILPGQCSSLIVTPTVMSQVLPTATVQPVKLTENSGPNQCMQVVTLPSNAYLQPTITQSLKVENGQVSQVGDTSMPKAIQVIAPGTKKNSNVGHALDGNALVGNTVASKDIPPKNQTPKVMNSNIVVHPQIPSTSVATSHEKTGPSQHNRSLSDNICVDNTSAIVLTAEQLAEVMAGKPLEEVLQDTISEQGLESVLVVESTASAVSHGTNTISDVGIDQNKISNVQPVPMKETETGLADQNVFEMKYVGTKLKQNHVLPRSVKHKLSPQIVTPISPVKKHLDEKSISSDNRKVLTPKPITPFLEIKKTLPSVLPIGITKTSGTTTISSLNPESKTIGSGYTKVSAFTPYRPTSAQCGTKLVDERQPGKTAVASGTPVSQNVNIPNNKSMPKSFDGNKVYTRPDILHKSIFRSPTKKIYSSDKIPPPPEQHGKQNKLGSQANVIKSVVHNPVISKGDNRKHLDKAFENHKKTIVSPAEVEREKADIIKSGKVMFSRSFKKTPSDSKKRIKKTLKEMEKTYPKEVNEILTIREAIKSSHVGDGESAMRQLAKLEIENQLKRFSQKVNAIKNASPEKRIDYRRRKIHTEADKSNRASKTDTTQNDGNNESKKTDSDTVKDHVRKRERPKKFDDFVLSSKPKKEKKSKSRKFFFPEEMDEKTPQGDEDEEVAQDEALVPKNEAAENLETRECKENKSICNNDQKEHLKGGSVLSNKENNISPEYVKKEKKENLSGSMPGKVTVEKDEKTLKDLKSISSEKKEKDFLTTSNNTQNKKVKSETYEERSFMDAISGDVTPTVKEEGIVSENNKNREDLPDKESDDLNQGEQDKRDSDKDEESIDEDEADQETSTQKNKTDNKVKKKKRRKKKPTIAYEPEVLPEHLKRKPKVVIEETVIDLSKVQMKSSCIESTFELSDTIQLETFELLKRQGWVCTFCGKPGNIGNLDVLFGPYVVKVSNSDSEKNRMFCAWMHRDCAIWTSSICLSSHVLCGLGEALSTAAKMSCSLCTKVGATLQCSSRQCRDNYHFVCAKQRGCSFNIENFTITCPKHK